MYDEKYYEAQIGKPYPDGELHISDQDILFRHGRGIVVDIGVMAGKSTALFAISGAERVVGVGLFEDVDQIKNAASAEFYSDLFSKRPHHYSAVCEYFNDFKNVEIIKGESTAVSNSFGQETVDVVFIDADHSYDGVKADYEAWFNSVKIGGDIIFHDSCGWSVWPAVDFCNDLKADRRVNLIEQLGSCSVFRKVSNGS